MNSRQLLALFLAGLLAAGYFFWSASEGGGGRQPSGIETRGGATGLRSEPDLARDAEPLVDGGHDLGVLESEAPLRLAAEQGAPNARASSELADGVSVIGTILGPTGEPLAGAEVSGALDEEDGVGYPGFESGFVSVLSGKDGGFQLDGCEPGRFRLRVVAAGCAPLDRRGLALPREARYVLGRVQMDWGLVLEGLVLDESGTPLAGVGVHSEALEFNLFGTADRRLQATTDAAGRFLAERMPVGPWRLVAESEAHPEAVLEGPASEPGTHIGGLVIQLEAGHSISGKVLGIPPQETRSFVLSARLVELEGQWGKPQRQVLIAPDGSFELGGLRVGEDYALAVYPNKDWPEIQFEAPSSNPLRATAGERGVVLTFVAGSSLCFRVVDAQSQAAISGLLVQAGCGYTNALKAREFADGNVCVPNLRPEGAQGLCELRISSVGYRDYVRDSIELSTGQALDLGVIELQPIPVVRVTVLDRLTGEPIEAARVWLRNESAPGSTLNAMGYGGSVATARLHGGVEHSGRTNAEGLAVLNGFEDQVCSIRASARGYAPTVLRNIHLPLRRDFAQTLELDSGGSVLVSVFNSDGDPQGGVQVARQIEPADEQDLGWPSARSQPGVTDARGQVRFEHLQPGSHRFRIEVDAQQGSPWRNSSPRNMDAASQASVLVKAGAESALALRAPTDCVLFGRLLEAGKPLVGASVKLLGEPDGDMGRRALLAMDTAGTTSDSSGRYRLEGHQAGPYELYIQHSNRSMPASYRVELVEGDNEADLDLGLSIIEGRVVSTAGDALQGVRVRVLPFKVVQAQASDREHSVAASGLGMAGLSAGQLLVAQSSAEGMFRLRGVQPGVELVLMADGPHVQAWTSASLVLGVDELRQTKDLVLERAGSIRLELLVAGAKPSFCSVLATWAGEAAGPPPIHQIAHDGQSSLSGLRPGLWRLELNSLGIGLQAAAAAATLEIEVRQEEEFFQLVHLEPEG